MKTRTICCDETAMSQTCVCCGPAPKIEQTVQASCCGSGVIEEENPATNGACC